MDSRTFLSVSLMTVLYNVVYFVMYLSVYDGVITQVKSSFVIYKFILSTCTPLHHKKIRIKSTIIDWYNTLCSRQIKLTFIMLEATSVTKTYWTTFLNVSILWCYRLIYWPKAMYLRCWSIVLSLLVFEKSTGVCTCSGGFQNVISQRAKIHCKCLLSLGIMTILVPALWWYLVY